MKRILAALLLLQTAFAGDFDRFNSLFKDAFIVIPDDFTLTQKVLLTTLKLYIRNIRCYKISVENISISHNRRSNQLIEVPVDVSNLDIRCDVDYQYEYGFLHGTGVAFVLTDNNSFSSKLNFQSQNFDNHPPSQSSSDGCSANIQIAKIDFHGDFVSNIVEIFEGMIKDVIEGEIEKVACQELGSLGTSFVSDTLGLVGDLIDKYKGDMGPSANDPLHLENTLSLPAEFNGFNLQESDTVVGNFLNQAIEQAANLLGASVPDPSGPNANQMDLAINVLMRSNFLDGNRALFVDISKLPIDAVLFKGHDQITETSITLNSVRVLGLDTLTKFDSLNSIGKYTLQNSLKWKSLRVEFDVTVDIFPSTRPDAILQDSSSQGISERITIDFGVDNIEVIASLLVVIDEDKLGSMAIGPLLTQENLFPCAQSLLHKLELSGMHVDPLVMKSPTLTGFVSPGMDRLLTSSVEAAFAMYSGVLRDAIPNIFQTSVRDFVNTDLLSSNIFSQNEDSSTCPEPKDVSGFIDFRDLFLHPWVSKTMGGSGTEPYGDIAYTLFELLDDQLLATDANGVVKLNEYIGPATKAQSGTAGTLKLLSDEVSIVKTKFANDYIHSFVDRFEVGIYGVEINNLDTLVPPIKLLQTTYSPHTLENRVNIGPVPSKPLYVTTGIRFTVEGEDSPLDMAHHLVLGVSLDSAKLQANLEATVDANRFLHFPLKDILVPECWMSLIPSGSGLSIKDVIMAFEAFDMNMNVISSSSLGMSVFSDLLDLLKTHQGHQLLKDRFGDFVAQVLDEDKIQTQIDRALVDAPKVCPHSVEYDASFESDGALALSFPEFTPEIVDTLFYTASFLAEIGFLAFLEDQSLRTWNETSALSAQEKVATPNSLLNLTKTEGSLGSLVELAVSEASSYLGGTVGKSSDELRVNELIRDLVLNGEAEYKIDFDESFDLPGVTFEIVSLSFGGIDSFTRFSTLDVIGPQTILNEMDLKNLSLTFKMRAIDPSTKQTMQDFAISLSLENIKATVPIFVAINEADLASIPLSSIMQIDKMYSCILSVVQSIEMTQMNVTFDSFTKPVIEGLMSDSNEILQKFTDEIMSSYGDLIQTALPVAIDHTLRPLLNGLAEVYLQGIECESNEIPQSETGFVDFRKLFLPATRAREYGATEDSQYGDLFPWLFEIFQDLVSDIDKDTGLSGVNRGIVSGIVESYSGSPTSLIYPEDLYNVGSRIRVGGLDATVKFRASDARIENVDTLGSPIAILEPVSGEPHELNNTATLGTDDRPLRFAMRLLVSMMGDDNMQLENDVEISLDLKSVTVVLHAMLKMLESRLFNFPLGDALNYNCWLATIPAPRLDPYGLRDDAMPLTAEMKEILATVGSIDLNVSCVSCTSPRMSELTELLSTIEARDDIKETTNWLLSYAKELADDGYMQIQIDRLLNDAARQCPHSPMYQENAAIAEYKAFEIASREFSIEFLLMLTALAGSIVLAFFLLALVIRCFVRRRHNRWLKALPADQVRRLAQNQEDDKQEAARLNAATTPMYRSPQIPLLVRVAMPLIILGNIGFFMSGHLSLGATVNIEGELAGQKVSVRNFFEFSMAKSTVDIWNAGGKELAILILIFSGIWPYTKQLITLVLWFLPPSKCSVTRRESILLWLDCLGKWSMIDIFVLVISIAAFRISIASPSVDFLPEDFYSLDLLVVPLWGLYANMIAQLISQVSSHYIIHYHRQIVKEARSRMEQDEPLKLAATGSTDGDSVTGCPTETKKKIAPYAHRYGRPHRGETDKLVVKPYVNKGLLVCSIGLFAAVVFGSIATSFSLEILGIIGVAVESGQNFKDAKTPHSVFTVVQLLFEEASFLDTAGDYIGLGTLSLLFVFTVLVVPLLQSLALLRQWYKPSTGADKVKMSIIIEILQAWQYAEVYLIAIFVASWQLGPISEFMINSYCESLRESLGELVYYGILKAEDAQCFSVESTIEGGSYILALGAILLAITTSFVNKSIIQYFRDVKNEENLQKEDRWGDESSDSDTESGGETKPLNTRIHPVPVLFTDRFRWLMMRDDHRGVSQSYLSAFGKFRMSSKTNGSSATPDDCGDEESNSDDDDSKPLPRASDHFEDESGWSSVDESTQHNTE